MALDKRYLEKHGAQWRVQMKVPKHLQQAIGKVKLVRPLHTDSLAHANRLRWPIINEFKALFETASKTSRTSVDPIVSEALQLRKELEEAKDDPYAFADYGPDGEVAAFGETVLSSFAGDRAEEISETDGHLAASLFFGVATGTQTPIDLLIDKWLTEAEVKTRQKIDYRRAVTKVSSYLTSNKKEPVLEALKKRTAGEYVSSLSAKKINPVTINKDISALSSYWKWLIKKGYLEANVWERQSLPKPKKSKNKQKRPYTDLELLTLFAAPCPLYLKDAMTIAALSGMRIEEIARLQVRYITTDRCFHIAISKTEAGERMVPIHRDLEDIVRRRVGNKEPDAYLFHELPTPAPDSPIERSQKVSKAFTAFRRKLGVDDLPEGHRQSRVDFHSFRRWFVNRAGQALSHGGHGFTQWTIAQVVGHEREQQPLGMTMGRYHGADDFEALRACVASVSLPKVATT